ncbi:MAG TPA: lytic transglycosylase domain-containing protein [Ferruginibacter sp.]|nr:lytic transglycosylase domain-containing protein [Ferruginibacter sp.]
MTLRFRSGKKKTTSFTVSTPVLMLFFTLGITTASQAGSYTDTSKKSTPVQIDKKDAVDDEFPEPNINFPAVLAGNEDESLEYIEKFSENRRAYVIRTYNRGKKYFPKISAILKKYNLPDELKMLIALESAFNANAVSKAGAVGYWQFMDDVAREYGLKYVPRNAARVKKVVGKGKHAKVIYAKKHVSGRDDRKNFNKSTHAAARYLKDRGRNLNNDILLMVASYNCGVGNVWEAMKKTGLSEPGFWDIKEYLPAETRAYVMNFITLNVLFHNYDKFSSNSLSFSPARFMKLDNIDKHIVAALEEACCRD